MSPRSKMLLFSLLLVLTLSLAACSDTTTSRGACSAPPVASATPAQATMSSKTPILGSSWQTFDTLFGHSNCYLGNGWNYQGKFGPTWTGTDEAGDPQPSNPNSRVTEIETLPQPGEPNWSTSQAQAMVAQFMPPDAKLVQTKTVSDAAGDALGSEMTYTSLLLAHTLPATDFKDANGKQVSPGTFYVYLNNGLRSYDRSVLSTDEIYVVNS